MQENSAQWLAQFMRDGGRQLAHLGQPLEMADMGAVFLRLPLVGDVYGRAEKTTEGIVGDETRHADIEDPAILPIPAAQAVLTPEGPPRIEGVEVGLQAMYQK